MGGGRSEKLTILKKRDIELVHFMNFSNILSYLEISPHTLEKLAAQWVFFSDVTIQPAAGKDLKILNSEQWGSYVLEGKILFPAGKLPAAISE